MWLSQEITNDPEVKKTLQEITRLIKDYSDATDMKKRGKLLSANIGRFFRPRLSTYFSVLLSIAVIQYLSYELYDLGLSVFNDWVQLSRTISLPILVLGISLSTVAKGLSESSQFASEYLKDSCRIHLFACITFITVFYGYLSGLLFPVIEKSIVYMTVYILLSPVCIGGAIWCLTSLIYIILETTDCMYPEVSIEAASNYASRKLSYATLKKVYIYVWTGKYKYILNQCLKDCENIDQSYAYVLREKNDNDKMGEYHIRLPKETDFRIGYRDYELTKLKMLNKLLKSKNVKLHLTPHGYNSKEFGVLSYEEPYHEVFENIRKELLKIYRFGKDRHVEEEKGFWDEHYLKLHNALLRAIKNASMAQFRKYLKSIEGTHVFFRRARSNRFIRKYLKPDYENFRYLDLYSKSVKWMLESTNMIEEDVLVLFLYAMIESIEQQVEEDIEFGDWCVLDGLKWLVPNTYSLFNRFGTEKKSRLWELRARIGGFYEYAGDQVSQHGNKIQKEDKLQIQLTLHKGIIHWLLVARENKDDELIKSLCVASRRLVFPNKIIEFTPQQLVTQHFVLCGKVLEWLMNKDQQISPQIFRLLCFDEYDHTTSMSIDFGKLVSFYLENRGADLLVFLHEFSSTDWEKNPLSGGGHGIPHHIFSGNIEIDYMFIYLSLLRLPFLSEVQPVALDSWGYGLKDKVERFEGINRDVGIYNFNGSKDKLEKWLDACDELLKQKG